MSDMKCPFCGKKLWYDEQDGIYRCMKSACVMDYEGGTEQFWQTLIQTQKALDVAVDKLRDIDKTRSVANHKIGTQDKTLNSGIVFCWTTPDEIHNTLEQITELTKGGDNE